MLWRTTPAILRRVAVYRASRARLAERACAKSFHRRVRRARRSLSNIRHRFSSRACTFGALAGPRAHPSIFFARWIMMAPKFEHYRSTRTRGSAALTGERYEARTDGGWGGRYRDGSGAGACTSKRQRSGIRRGANAGSAAAASVPEKSIVDQDAPYFDACAREKLTDSECVGRMIWFKATAGNDRFHTYTFQQRVGLLVA